MERTRGDEADEQADPYGAASGHVSAFRFTETVNAGRLSDEARV
jgi:hypothetical protein